MSTIRDQLRNTKSAKAMSSLVQSCIEKCHKCKLLSCLNEAIVWSLRHALRVTVAKLTKKMRDQQSKQVVMRYKILFTRGCDNGE